MPQARLLVYETPHPGRIGIEAILDPAGLPVVRRHTATRKEFVESLMTFRPDLVLCEDATHDVGAVESIGLVREMAPEASVVVIADLPGEEREAECMKAGAADYVLRGRDHRLLAIIRDAVEKKRRTRELHRLERLHQQLFQQTHNFICIARQDGSLEEANPAWLHITGLVGTAWIGRPLDEFIDPIDRPTFHLWWSRLASAGPTSLEISPECEVRLVSPTGGPRSVTWTASINREDGLIYASGHDTTQRRASEALLREGEARFRALADSAPVLVWIADTTQSRTYCNRPWREFTGREFEQEVHRGWMDLVHPDDASRVRAAYNENFSLRTAFKVEYRLRRYDGSFRWILDCGSPNRDHRGHFVGFIGSCIDISDQHEAESRLTQRAIKQAALAGFGRFALAQHPAEDLTKEATRLICETLDVDLSQVLSLSDQTCSLALSAATGMDASSWTGSPVNFATEWLQDGVLTLADHAEQFPGRESHAGQTIVDGLAVAISATKHPCGFVTALSRTPRVFNREAIDFVQALANILGAVDQREKVQAALAESEQKLLQSQKMEAVGLLAGGVAHDFNNLLTAIRCYGDILHDDLGQAAPELQPKAGEILKATARASALTRQLLAFSRKQILQPEILDLNSIVTDLRDLLRSLLSENVVLNVQTSPLPAYFEADRNQIDQVIINLCINARDAMPHGGAITVAIGSRALDGSNPHGLPPGEYVELALSDTGLGMTEEVQSQLFQPFFTTKPKGRGTGLGLATCAVIVKSSQGAIHFTSRVGEGTTFHVLFPTIPSLSFDQSMIKDDEVGEGTERILLVEDDEAIRAVTTAILETLGYRVHAVAGGSEALEYCAANPIPEIDLLLTDIVMPFMDGRDLAEQISRRCPGIGVLFMSGYVGDPSILEAVQSAGARFLEKPFTRGSLGRKVRDALDASPH